MNEVLPYPLSDLKKNILNKSVYEKQKTKHLIHRTKKKTFSLSCVSKSKNNHSR